MPIVDKRADEAVARQLSFDGSHEAAGVVMSRELLDGAASIEDPLGIGEIKQTPKSGRIRSVGIQRRVGCIHD